MSGLPALLPASVPLMPVNSLMSNGSSSSFGEVLGQGAELPPVVAVPGLPASGALPSAAPPGARPPAVPDLLGFSPPVAAAPKRARAAGPAPAIDPLDPAMRQAAHFAPPPGTTSQAPASAPPTPAQASMEELLPGLVRRVAWSGDGRKGAIRLELGSGALAGAEVLVESDHGRVRVALRGPGGVDLGDWRERIARRLAARGLQVDEIDAG